jgi:thiamine pyrophosphate-dependent acetolactate synthase large subunit-like protein
MHACIPLIAALEVLIEARTSQIVVTTMGTAREWPRMSQHPLDFHFVPSSMGQAPALGLGLALAQPKREVLVFNGDGCMLMNPGVLATISASGARNLTVIVFDNGIYEVTGGQKTAAAVGRVDYPALARSMGFAPGSVAQFEESEAWRRGLPAVLAAPGPRFIALRIAPVAGDTHLEAPGPIVERIARFRAALFA